VLPALGIGRLICGLSVVLIASVSLTACGDSKSGAVVARVGGRSITKSSLERWTAIEAVLAYETNPRRPPPRGIVPDPPAYVNCVAYLKAESSAADHPMPSATQLKRRCDKRHTSLQRHVLDILLIYYWLRNEAAERGVEVTSSDVEHVLDRIFPSAAAYHRYLAITGERPADERLIIQKDLLDTKLLQLDEAKYRQQTTAAHQSERALVEAAKAFTKKWRARTSCSAGYVVSECEQYRGPPSLVAP
jgi:hypothetical protein